MVDRSGLSKNVKYQEPSVKPIFFIHLYEYAEQRDMYDFNTPDPPLFLTESYLPVDFSCSHDLPFRFRNCMFQ